MPACRCHATTILQTSKLPVAIKRPITARLLMAENALNTVASGENDYSVDRSSRDNVPDCPTTANGHHTSSHSAMPYEHMKPRPRDVGRTLDRVDPTCPTMDLRTDNDYIWKLNDTHHKIASSSGRDHRRHNPNQFFSVAANPLRTAFVEIKNVGFAAIVTCAFIRPILHSSFGLLTLIHI